MLRRAALRRAVGMLAVLAVVVQGLSFAGHTAASIAAEAPLYLEVDLALCQSGGTADKGKAGEASGGATHCDACFTVQPVAGLSPSGPTTQPQRLQAVAVVDTAAAPPVRLRLQSSSRPRAPPLAV